MLPASNGVFDLNIDVKPYNLALKDMPTRLVQAWAEQELEHIKQRVEDFEGRHQLSDGLNRECASEVLRDLTPLHQDFCAQNSMFLSVSLNKK